MLKVLGALLITGGLGAAGYLTSFLLAKERQPSGPLWTG